MKYRYSESSRRAGTAYYDASAKKQDPPKWSLVHVRFHTKFAAPIPLAELRELSVAGQPLHNMQMLRQGRLSVSRVTEPEWIYLVAKANELETNDSKHEVAKGENKIVYTAEQVKKANEKLLQG
jgi:predicted RNA-binding protein with PUA-like domain